LSATDGGHKKEGSSKVNPERKIEGHTEATLEQLMLSARCKIKYQRNNITIQSSSEEAIHMFRI